MFRSAAKSEPAAGTRLSRHQGWRRFFREAQGEGGFSGLSNRLRDEGPRLTRRIARSALHSLGIIGCARWLSRNGVRILMYHRFEPDQQGLTRQCEHIRRHYTPVSLQEIAASYRGGKRLPANALAVTVDDGYRDFLTCGYPVLRAFDIPATVFLVTDFIDGNFWLWWDTFAYVFEHTQRQTITVSLPDGSTRTFGLSSPGERHAAHTTICSALVPFPVADRVRLFAEITGMLEVTLPPAPPSQYSPLTWDEVRTLAARGVEFGAHTRTHPILSSITDSQQLHEEIMTSKRRIESEIGESVIHFCYPNGRRVDFTDDAVDVIRRGGFETAVTTEGGINFPRQPPFLLRRLGVQPEYPVPYLEELLAGVRTG